MRLFSPVCAVVTLLLLACAPPPDPESALQSGAIARSSDGGTVWAAHPDEGAVSRTDLTTGTSTVLPLAGAPTHVARVGTQLYVSLPADGSIAVLDVSGSMPEPVSEHAVGSEPAGLVASRLDGHLFVAVAGEGRVVELDPASFAELRGWDVPGFPSGLALHPDGQSVYVTSTFGGQLTRIDLDTGTMQTAEVPVDEVVSTDSAGHEVAIGERQPRFTSAPTLSEGGDRLAVGLQRLDTTTAGASGSYVTFDESEGPRVQSAVAWTELSEAGELGELELVDATLDPGDDSGDRFSALVALAWSPDGERVAASMEAADVVGIYDLGEGAPVFALRLPAPGGVFVDDGGLVAQAGFGTSLVPVELDALEATAELTWVDVPAGEALSLPGLPAAVERGRQLFRTAVDASISLPGTGTSCSGCHTSAGTDGLTWALPDGYRQTPALHGGTAATAPYQWDGEVESIADEALATSHDRMGGVDMTDEQAADIAAWVGSRRTLAPPTRVDPEAASRGAELFESLACSSCHPGARGTDGERHEIGGVLMDTPGLEAIAHTAPYLHSGGAADLGEVIDYAAAGKMGAAFSISASERDDLIVYLRTR